jgi:hypothetical protein
MQFIFLVAIIIGFICAPVLVAIGSTKIAIAIVIGIAWALYIRPLKPRVI